MPQRPYRVIQVGTGKGRAGLGGLLGLDVVTTGRSNTTTGEDDLSSETIYANTFYQRGQSARIIAAGLTATNGNNKTVKLYFGGTEIFSTGAAAANNKPWRIDAIISRASKDTQICIAHGLHNAALVAPVFNSLTIDDDADIIVKVTGEGTDTGDVLLHMFLVEILGSPRMAASS
jgi:hypothetical protein